MSVKYFFVVFLLIFTVSPVYLSAQTAEELELLLETRAVTCGQAARFVLLSASDESADISEAEAFRQAAAKGWLSRGLTPDKPIIMENLSFLLMNALKMEGGLMYRIFPGPRYAYKTLTGRSFIQGACDSDMTVSGERFLLILGNVLSAAEEE